MAEKNILRKPTVNDWQGLAALFVMALYCKLSLLFPGGNGRLFFSPLSVVTWVLAALYTVGFVRCLIFIQGRRELQMWLGVGGSVFCTYLAAGLWVQGYDVYVAWFFFIILNGSATALKKPIHALSMALGCTAIMTLAHYLTDPVRLPYAWWFFPIIGLSFISATYAVLRSSSTYRHELRNRNKELAAKQHELDAILSSVHPIITYKDTENRIVKVNNAFAEMVGPKPEALVGVSLYELLPQDLAKKYHEEDLEIIRSGAPKMGMVEQVTTPDGSNKFWFRSNKTPIFDSDGTAIGLVIYAEDITGEMEARQQLKASEQQLRTYARQLEESNQNLQEFAYVISHDLREPLRSITAYTQLLQRQLKNQSLSTDAQEFMQFIVDAAKRMDRQINGILEYSRVGRAVLNLEKLPLGSVLETVGRNLHAQIVDTGATLEIPSELPEIAADRMQLTLLVQNLVSNALKYRKPDVPPRIRISAERQNGHWEFAVADNGLGIEPQYLENIFGVFQRLHTSSDIEGSGIGLSICRRIVQRHGGRIWVESEFGAGSTFRFTLPVEQEQTSVFFSERT